MEQDLPAGLMSQLKAAIREAVQAAAAKGLSGAMRVQILTGYSGGIISRWQNDNYKDLPSLDTVFALEFITQQPVFAKTFADLTGHRLVPIDDVAAPDDMVGELVRVTGAAAKVSTEFAAALDDGELTPAEAKKVLSEIGRQEVELARLKRKLAAIRPKGGG
jgi:hypothetical protein